MVAKLDCAESRMNSALVFPHRSRSAPTELGIFIGQKGLAQMTINLFEQRVNLKINDDSCRVGKAFGAFSIAARLRVILHSQVKFGAFIPGGAQVRKQFNCTVEMGFAGGK